jgi:hypothetical protein
VSDFGRNLEQRRWGKRKRSASKALRGALLTGRSASEGSDVHTLRRRSPGSTSSRMRRSCPVSGTGVGRARKGRGSLDSSLRVGPLLRRALRERQRGRHLILSLLLEAFARIHALPCDIQSRWKGILSTVPKEGRGKRGEECQE